MPGSHGSGPTITGATRVACVIGDPVEHSRSPRMHNAASQALGLDRIYVAFRVAPAELAEAGRGLAALGLDGVNVTLPHKAAAVALCDELAPEALMPERSTRSASRPRGDSRRSDRRDRAARGPAGGARTGGPARRGGSARAAAAALLRAGTRRLRVVERRLEARMGWLCAGPLAPGPSSRRWRRCPRERGFARALHAPGGIADLKGLPVSADVIERMDCRRFRISRRRLADAARRRGDGCGAAGRRRARAARAAGRPVLPALDGRRAAARRHAPRGPRRVSATVAALAAVGGGVGALGWDPLEPSSGTRRGPSSSRPGRAPSRRGPHALSAIACGATGSRFGASAG